MLPTLPEWPALNRPTRCCGYPTDRSRCGCSERNFVVHVLAPSGARHGGLARRAPAAERSEVGSGIVRTEIPAAARAIKHGKLGAEALQHHLGRVAILALLILPFARLQLALDVDLRTLLQILLGHLGEILVEDHYAVPLGPFPPLAGRLVPPGFGSRQPQVDDRPTVLGPADFGIGAKIADQDYLINATSHVRSPLRRMTLLRLLAWSKCTR